jgi:anti-anti-sigma factor
MARTNNAAIVRAMWDAWSQEGVDAFLALVPEDVEWRPHVSGGKPLWGSGDVRSLFKRLEERGERLEAEITEIEEIGEESVLVAGTMRRHGPQGTAEDQMAWLYSFRDGRLWRASAHNSQAEAREAARFAGQLTRPAERGPGLTVSSAEEDDLVRITMQGELDIATAGFVNQAIADAAAPGVTIRVELDGLDFMDSTGMRSIIEASRAATQNGWTLQLGRAREPVQRVFSVSGLERLLPFDPPEAG